jgi:U2-associated protein SR140
MFSLKKAGAKAKAEAEAKAREDKSALDKVIADFEKDHGADSDGGGFLGESAEDHDVAPDVFVPTGAKRHFSNRARSTKSGPGTLAPEPGLGFTRPGAPGAFGGTPHGRLGASVQRGPPTLQRGQAEENVYTTVIAKASNLPPSIDTRRIEALFSEFDNLKVVKVENLPPSRPSTPTSKRPSATMKITFSKDATARDLDSAMNKMNDKKYLGKGYYLHLDRYLGGRSMSTRQREEPFGATLHDPEVLVKGFAPPEALGGDNRERAREETMNKRMLVTANAPPDPATLRLIHQTIESVVEGGTEFEAALMHNPWVQEEERFAWLYDQKHPLNRYYRYRLHEIVSMSDRTNVFFRQPDWKGPKEPFVDEFACEFQDVNHPDQKEGSGEDEDEQPAGRFTVPTGENYPGRNDTGYGIMSPKSRTMLIWMLSGIPPSSLVNGDIAPISYFAVEHYTRGMDEVVHLLVTNIFQPFALSKANPNPRRVDGEGGDGSRKASDLVHLTINALRVVSDVIFVTWKAQSHCYKYRLFFALQLRERKVFEYLETLPSHLSLGRLSEKEYRDSVNEILAFWEKEFLFEADLLTYFDHAFNFRKREKEQKEREKRLAAKRTKKKGVVPQKRIADLDGAVDNDNDDEYEDENDDENNDAADDDAQMEEQADVAGVDKLDGANNGQVAPHAPDVALGVDDTGPSADANEEMKPMEGLAQQEGKHSVTPAEIPGETAAARARRLRPKAEDMFASDEE